MFLKISEKTLNSIILSCYFSCFEKTNSPRSKNLPPQKHCLWEEQFGFFQKNLCNTISEHQKKDLIIKTAESFQKVVHTFLRKNWQKNGSLQNVTKAFTNKTILQKLTIFFFKNYGSCTKIFMFYLSGHQNVKIWKRKNTGPQEPHNHISSTNTLICTYY